MSQSDGQQFDDQVLMRYLLGRSSDDEAGRLDELSITDDQFASRLNAVENDLLDAYVRGELSGETLDRFRLFYLASPRRREKVRFAEALLAHESRTAVAQTAPAYVPLNSERPEAPSQRFSWRRLFLIPQFIPQPILAAMAVVVILAIGFLIVDDVRLRKDTAEMQADRAALGGREKQLETQLAELRSANDLTLRELEQTRASQMSLDRLNTLSLLLPPPTRGLGRIPEISIPPGTNLVVLLLALESDDFPAYRVVLKDPAANQMIWQSGVLRSTPGGERKTVTIGFRAELLKNQDYVAELTGVSSRGRPEFIGVYPFRTVLK